jgi:hypothetical protein
VWLVHGKGGKDSTQLRSGAFASAPFAAADDRVDILKAANATGDVNLVVRAYASGGMVELVCDPTKCKDGDNYLVKLGSFDGLVHGEQVHFYVTKTDPNSTAPTKIGEYAVNYKEQISFSGVVVPLLYKIEGNAVAFGTSKLAPSIGLGWQGNRESKRMPFIGIEGLFTVNPNSNSADAAAHPYSAGWGAVIDFGGWFQAGGTYSSQSKKWNGVVGLRESVWSRIFGK